MNDFKMRLKATTISEGFLTFAAFEGFFHGVGVNVGFQIILGLEPFSAQTTNKRFFQSVAPEVI